MQNRIAELEAENAELKKDLAHEIDMACQAKVCAKHTREQIAALVKGLEWYGKAAKIDRYGAYEVGCNVVSAKWFWTLCNTSGHTICVSVDDEPFETESEARAAAEAHHRETVLSLLNL